jgi:hypothetical protein
LKLKTKEAVKTLKPYYFFMHRNARYKCWKVLLN